MICRLYFMYVFYCKYITLYITIKKILLYITLSAENYSYINIREIVKNVCFSNSITIHLKSLHWLPVKVRSTYKIACLCYHCHSSAAPSYVTDMLHRKPLHTRTSSYNMPLLNRPAHSKATLCDRSFSFASSSV